MAASNTPSRVIFIYIFSPPLANSLALTYTLQSNCYASVAQLLERFLAMEEVQG